MKTILLICALFISFATLSFETHELFTKKQRDSVVEAIDNICADTWCEGDYNFEFVDFKCNKNTKSCQLRFYFINTEDNKDVKSSIQTCHFFNITKLEQVLDKHQSLDDKFYGELDACISDLEEKLR